MTGTSVPVTIGESGKLTIGHEPDVVVTVLGKLANIMTVERLQVRCVPFRVAFVWCCNRDGGKGQGDE